MDYRDRFAKNGSGFEWHRHNALLQRIFAPYQNPHALLQPIQVRQLFRFRLPQDRQDPHRGLWFRQGLKYRPPLIQPNEIPNHRRGLSRLEQRVQPETATLHLGLLNVAILFQYFAHVQAQSPLRQKHLAPALSKVRLSNVGFQHKECSGPAVCPRASGHAPVQFPT